ncbi:hypothetical protein BO94DRAFT_504351 [Aspergillus sclerotioniger CBS 115572]|uniref:BZIP domain-containing protein n=1 Tax=Aspergillus sclerotioniger CBS 115572 TaxID=1450535 RepID=A0A317UXQ8_9EURO|nr:hypothetical protein BO94DRAFT_504351 [Aspergillus sclerotioniger CBS 115572]PWY66376.1 hypothetical protein BO94DRAFT_504351 [Aspergillus sclerotioniger CBS 115572]
MSKTTAEPSGDLSGTDGSHSSHSQETAKQERRRWQNRQNQRAYRERQRIRKQAERLAEEHALQQPNQVAAYVATQYPVPDLSILASLSREAGQNIGPIATTSCALAHPRIYRLLSVFEAAAYRSYHGNPQADHLLTLAKLNMFRAFVRNIAMLGYTREWMTDDALSRFSIHGPHPKLPVTTLPPSLQPTDLQRRQIHHPWLDFFPFARLRDNLIENEDCMDEAQFCRDLMGFWTVPGEHSCMLVWGDPWDPMNWEITEAFLQKWGRLVKGCPEILWSTNHWRRLRGEKRLVWKASFDTIAEV